MVMKEMDRIDETKLNVDQMRSVCATLFGGTKEDYPHPATAGWVAFMGKIREKNASQPMVWNPFTKQHARWVDESKLIKAYGKDFGGGGGGCCVIV